MSPSSSSVWKRTTIPRWGPQTIAKSVHDASNYDLWSHSFNQIMSHRHIYPSAPVLPTEKVSTDPKFNSSVDTVSVSVFGAVGIYCIVYMCYMSHRWPNQQTSHAWSWIFTWIYWSTASQSYTLSHLDHIPCEWSTINQRFYDSSAHCFHPHFITQDPTMWGIPR